MKNFLPNKAYDALCYVCIIVLPALGAFYGTLATIWNLPYPEQIPQTILAVEVLLGALLMISKATYKGGE